MEFIDLTLTHVVVLFLVGFAGGLVSGFIGSGGAFVLTPAMISLGVPGIVSVASNMCHKFPKALVGAVKRAEYGQVDVKLGVVLGISAEIGVIIGADFQTSINRAYGAAGSNLYVSLALIITLLLVGGFVLHDVWKTRLGSLEEQPTRRLALWLQSIHIPGTMMYFRSIDARVSVLFTIPIGIATGMLAATIAVGGFIGVPAMIYMLGVPGLIATATELVIAFIMGLGGSIYFAWEGFVDIRLAMIILAGSLFGIQLGAMSTTYVESYMVKLVMGLIMIIVAVSRGIAVPTYLSELGTIESLSTDTVGLLNALSFGGLVSALVIGSIVILLSLWYGMREDVKREEVLEKA
ncbi:MAG: TSUP family transporter [Deltaproteobacteria bacterium]|nr:TSUP family transporter [Deltaproteobacteria bacterium]